MPVKGARTNVQTRRPDDLVAEVARAYYEAGLTQQQIAERFGISRSQISRYLQEARDRDIVQIRIVAPESRDERAEEGLRTAFPHLREVIVTSVFSEHPRVARRSVARATAHLLERLVRPNSTVCFGAGRTLAETVDLLVPRGTSGVTVIQAMGNAGHEAIEIDYNAVAGAAASAFAGRSIQINAPAILGPGSSAANLEASNPQIRDALAVARSADLYVMGIGSMTGDQIYVTTGLISEDELAGLREEGAVGDLCGNFFDIDGRPHPGPFAERIVGIGLTDLGAARLAVACCSGAGKVQAVVGALYGRFVNVLVTDEHTARGVLELVTAEDRGHAVAGSGLAGGSASSRRI